MANNDFRNGFDVCVGNWGYYSEGELRDTWMHLPMDPDELPVFDYLYDDMYVEDQWHKTCLERSTPQENYAYTVLNDDSEFWNIMNREDGELLSCFDFNRFGEIAVNNGYVDLCETCYVNKGGDWPLLDEYSFEEIGGETVAEWRGRVAQEKPAAPSEIAYAASALAALSADDGAGVTARAAKL